MNKKLTSLLLSLSTSLFLTSCSQKPKQPVNLPPPPQIRTIYELEYPAPSTQPPQTQSQPAQSSQQPPTPYPKSQPTTPTFNPQPPIPKQNYNPQLTTQPTIAPVQTNKPDLEQILNQNYSVIKQELTTLVEQYVLGLEDHQDAHKNLMQEKPEEVYQNYLSLETGALNTALDAIKKPSSSQYRRIKLGQIALQYLEKSHELAPDAPIDFTSEELIEAYTSLLKLRESCLEETLKRALKKNKSYSTYKEMMTNTFTEKEYTRLTQQHIKATKHIKEAFFDSRTGIKGKFPYFAAQEIRNAAKFTSQFYLDTIERYFGD